MACKHPPIPHSPGTNWVEKVGGMPEFMDCVARALYWGSGKPKDKAYRMAVGIVEDWAAGRRGASPQVQAKAAAAVASWEAKRGVSKAKTAAKKA